MSSPPSVGFFRRLNREIKWQTKKQILRVESAALQRLAENLISLRLSQAAEERDQVQAESPDPEPMKHMVKVARVLRKLIRHL